MDIKEFFKKYNSAAIAFSGGVDSAFLLYCAKKCGADVTAYYVKSAFQPQFEFEDAKRIANELGIPLKVIETNILDYEEVRRNDPLRCYYCKRRIFSQIKAQAESDGYSVILDGTNASDDSGDRPGMKALKELKVLSPLRLCGYTKDEIRKQAKNAGLFVWNKPAYACLATRIKPNEEITPNALNLVEKAEMFMMNLGFKNIRVRVSQNEATIILKDNSQELLKEKRNIIEKEFSQYFYKVNFKK